MKEAVIDLPEPLYETYTLSSKDKVCLVCGQVLATSVLRTTTAEIVPLCRGCAMDWNWYGYQTQKKIKQALDHEHAPLQGLSLVQGAVSNKVLSRLGSLF